ncbi:MAG TPA: phosphoribosylaminoimidazolesuccinocarboxamide synthase, partial [Alphaproteobacteria bacterium]
MICLEHAEIPELPNPHRGKVRDSYDLGDGRRVIVATDRQSAFDRMLSPVPRKGEVLTRLSRYWFETTADLCRN